MNVQEYLSNYYKGTKNTTLEGIEYLLEKLSHPEKKLKIIHIAGTNGKGSCAEMMTNILIQAGYKVGKFIGPHLIRYNERISINNEDITDCEIERLINVIDFKIKDYNQEHETNITLFELETAMALLYFYENDCDFVILETGLGGLNDSTNVVYPIISIITSIGYDHMHILGNTLPEIAKQKAGIIKNNSETVFIKDKKEINDVIIKKCEEKDNLLHTIVKEEIHNYSYDNEFQKFDYKEYKNILINLKGEKQVYNATICLECVDILKGKAYKIPENAIREGLKTVVHKGRFEKINDNPTIIYDGGHNAPAIDNFKNSVQMYYKNSKKIYIISILKTKDYDMVLRKLLKDKMSTFIFTSGNNLDRYVLKEELLAVAKKYSNSPNLYAMELEDAIDLVRNNYKDSIVFIVGSFYIYGDVIEKLENGGKNESIICNN